MMYGVVRYEHRHGTDFLLCLLPDGATYQALPAVDNSLLEHLGVDVPELERDDEEASWTRIGKLEELPALEFNKDGRLVASDAKMVIGPASTDMKRQYCLYSIEDHAMIGGMYDDKTLAQQDADRCDNVVVLSFQIEN